MTDDVEGKLEGCLRMAEAVLDAMEAAMRHTGLLPVALTL